ncbi:MAG: COX15/CtaA family protein, partial [Pseudomonadota bacterium]|nr:COX15/CtaA family protein [Pseudomonadota bacterium]
MTNSRNTIVLTMIFSLIVIAMGAYTRLADAGLGCPDWPGCYGHLTVPSSAEEIIKAESDYPNAPPVIAEKAWPEMIHRYLAG